MADYRTAATLTIRWQAKPNHHSRLTIWLLFVLMAGAIALMWRDRALGMLAMFVAVAITVAFGMYFQKRYTHAHVVVEGGDLTVRWGPRTFTTPLAELTWSCGHYGQTATDSRGTLIHLRGRAGEVSVLALDLMLGRADDYVHEPAWHHQVEMTEADARSFLDALAEMTAASVSLEPPAVLEVAGYGFSFDDGLVTITEHGRDGPIATVDVAHVRVEPARWREKIGKSTSEGTALILHVPGEIDPLPLPERRIVVGSKGPVRWEGEVVKVAQPPLGSPAQLIALARRLGLGDRLADRAR